MTRFVSIRCQLPIPPKVPQDNFPVILTGVLTKKWLAWPTLARASKPNHTIQQLLLLAHPKAFIIFSLTGKGKQ
jgi:hypothetical protein